MDLILFQSSFGGERFSSQSAVNGVWKGECAATVVTLAKASKLVN